MGVVCTRLLAAPRVLGRGAIDPGGRDRCGDARTSGGRSVAADVVTSDVSGDSAVRVRANWLWMLRVGGSVIFLLRDGEVSVGWDDRKDY